MGKNKSFGRRILSLLPWQVRCFVNYSHNKHVILNLFSPKDYPEYIFRDNILDCHKKHTYLADKYEVRKYVEEQGLGHTPTKLYGIWDNADTINFDELPEQLAIRYNHNCTMNIIVFDRSELDVETTKKLLNKWFRTEYPIDFEVHYQCIKPLIICEELIKDNEDGSFPMDYKIHCANGKPIFIQYCFNRTEQSVGKRVIYDPGWKNLHYIVNDYHCSDDEYDKPKHLKEMLEYASILSKGLDYAHVDFYDTDKRPLLGEITLIPMGGWLTYFTPEALDVMGCEMRVNKNKK